MTVHLEIVYPFYVISYHLTNWTPPHWAGLDELDHTITPGPGGARYWPAYVPDGSYHRAAGRDVLLKNQTPPPLKNFGANPNGGGRALT